MIPQQIEITLINNSKALINFGAFNVTLSAKGNQLNDDVQSFNTNQHSKSKLKKIYSKICVNIIKNNEYHHLIYIS